MARLVVELILLGLACCAYARKCNPDEGVEPSPCDPSSCALPDCACEGSEPSVPLADRPQVYQAVALFITRLSHIIFFKRLVSTRYIFCFYQIVYITFDDAMTALADDLYYKGLFDGSLTNPDGCAIRATHFVSARSNDYTLVSKNGLNLFEFKIFYMLKYLSQSI